MGTKRTIAVATGTRAEYGLLKPLLDLLESESQFDFYLIVTGSHLSAEFGHTIDQIKKDGFRRLEEVDCLLSSDSDRGVAKAAGLVLLGCADIFARKRPDMVLVLGDRYEIHAVVSAATLFRIPVAHLHGGEITEGAMDNTIRHSITKLSHLHFVSTESHAKRVLQLGEEPERVYNVGAIGLDNIRNIEYICRGELEQKLGFQFRQRNILATFHPETLKSTGLIENLEEIIDYLAALPETAVFFTKANADQNGRKINGVISGFAEKRENIALFDSLGQQRYLSLMKEVDAVVGNSSSGIIEAPSLKVPTINVGSRQDGRERAASVIDCRPTRDDLERAFNVLSSREYKKTLETAENPYGNCRTAEKILEVLKAAEFDRLLYKRFNDLPG